MAKEIKKTKVRKAKRVASSKGRVYIMATNNNTLITLTDLNGDTIAWGSSGTAGFKGNRKSTPYASQVAAEAAAQKALDRGLKEVDVYMKGIGSGRESALRALKSIGLTVLSIADVTPVPHNGCRAKKPRRV